MASPSRSSMSAVGRSRRAWQASTLESEAQYTCDIGGCYKTYKTHSDWDRHRWTHMPENLPQRCPFVDSLGVKCSELYGCADMMRFHWTREHGSAGPFPSNPRLFTARAGHSSSLDQAAATESDPFSLEMPPSPPLRIYQSNSNPSEFYSSPDLVHEHSPRPTTPPYDGNSPTLIRFSHHTPDHTSSSPTNANSPDISQYFDCPSSPSRSALDVTGYSTAEAQYAQPPVHQVGSPDWELVDTSPQASGTKTPLEDWDLSSIMDPQQGLSTLHL